MYILDGKSTVSGTLRRSFPATIVTQRIKHNKYDLPQTLLHHAKQGNNVPQALRWLQGHIQAPRLLIASQVDVVYHIYNLKKTDPFQQLQTYYLYLKLNDLITTVFIQRLLQNVTVTNKRDNTYYQALSPHTITMCITWTSRNGISS